MSDIKKELKYSIGNDEINVWLTSVYPIANIDTNNYELINYVLEDINKNYLTINGALFNVKKDSEQLRDAMERNNYKLMNRNYKIKNKKYNIDKNKYRCSTIIADREKEYFAKHLNDLENVNTGLEIINLKLEKGNEKVYAFYREEELIGIMAINDEVPIYSLYADNKDIMVYMIQYIVNEYKKDIFITVGSTHTILIDALDEIGAEIEWNIYRGESQLN